MTKPHWRTNDSASNNHRNWESSITSWWQTGTNKASLHRAPILWLRKFKYGLKSCLSFLNFFNEVQSQQTRFGVDSPEHWVAVLCEMLFFSLFSCLSTAAASRIYWKTSTRNQSLAAPSHSHSIYNTFPGEGLRWALRDSHSQHKSPDTGTRCFIWERKGGKCGDGCKIWNLKFCSFLLGIWAVYINLQPLGT